MNLLQAKTSLPTATKEGEPKIINRKISTLRTPSAFMNNTPFSAWETSSVERDELGNDSQHNAEKIHKAEDKNGAAASAGGVIRKKSRKMMGKRARSPAK